MCEPSTAMMAASLAISAISVGASYDSGRKTAHQQADALQRAEQLNAMDASREQTQIAQQGAEQTNEVAKRMQARMATLDVIGGEFGGGGSFERGRAITGLQESDAMATIKSNTVARLNETAASGYARRSKTVSELRAIKRPSLALSGLQIGAAAINTYDRFADLKTEKKKS